MSGGSITVHSPSTCRELRVHGGSSRGDEAEEEEADGPAAHTAGRLMMVRSGVSSRDMGRLSRTASHDVGRLSRLSSAAQTANVQTWLTQKARRAVVALPEDPELVELRQLCDSILQREHELVSELESTLCSHVKEEGSKREMLYHKWSERVFSPLHARLASVHGSSHYRNMDTERRALFQRYLDYRNHKNVFLDTVSADEYNPLALRGPRTELRAVTAVLDDPLLTQQTDRDTEQRIISGSHGNEARSPGERATPLRGDVAMDAVSWLAVQLTHVDSDVRQRSRQRMKRDHNQMQGGGGVLELPHKTPITYPHTPASLAWPEPHCS